MEKDLRMIMLSEPEIELLKNCLKFMVEVSEDSLDNVDNDKDENEIRTELLGMKNILEKLE